MRDIIGQMPEEKTLFNANFFLKIKKRLKIFNILGVLDQFAIKENTQLYRLG